jgi:formylglycine-generating enzyme
MASAVARLGSVVSSFVAASTLAACAARAPTPAPDEGRAPVAAPDAPALAADADDGRATSRVAAPPPADDAPARTLREQRAQLFATMARDGDVTEHQLAGVEQIFAGSPYLGQGNPAVTKHPMSRATCRETRAAAGLASEPHPPCARANMVPVYDPGAGETAEDAKVCIDQFEFPNVACEYPVVYATAREAALVCQAVGKRICDAHEWEGACAGALHPPSDEYAFDSARKVATAKHNQSREVRWAHGMTKDHALCATGAWKTPACPGGGWNACGSNTYPAGSFPACVSPFGVYDQHGNAAEHMNLPLAPAELASAGGAGATEMKGSWFVFQHEDAHPDDCRWRAPDWHPSKLMSEASHSNYHLGFRCCADVDDEG